MLIVDAHEDVAWNMLAFGRDYSQSVADNRQREAGTMAEEATGKVMLGWPEWLTGRVAVIFATLFAPPKTPRPSKWAIDCYRNADEAHALYWQQLQNYHQLVATHPDKFRLLQNRADLEAVLQTWQDNQPDKRQIGLVILMEGADGIREPDELPQWVDQGVRLIGPAWMQTRYAGGTGMPGPLTDLGRALLQRMAEVNLILDVSHLADEGVAEALASYPGSIIASHSNARTLLSTHHPDRHLSDETISRLAARQGVIGIVLANSFLRDEVQWGDRQTVVTLADVVRQIDYICQLVGDTAHVGLGSDFDGGFGAEFTPVELDSVADLPLIGEALDKRGYSQADIEAIMGQNWLRLLRRVLP